MHKAKGVKIGRGGRGLKLKGDMQPVKGAGTKKARKKL